MKIKDLSLTFHTSEIKKCTDFYEKCLNARIIFDCGWYATLQFSSSVPQDITLSFIHPDYASGGVAEGGVTLNIQVEDVDAEFENMQGRGIKFLREVGDQPWGDRSFTLLDPLGNILYIYSPRPMDEEYAKAMK